MVAILKYQKFKDKRDHICLFLNKILGNTIKAHSLIPFSSSSSPEVAALPQLVCTISKHILNIFYTYIFVCKQYVVLLHVF